MKLLYALCATAVMCGHFSVSAISQTDWQKAKTEIIAQAKKNAKKYNDDCPVMVQMFELMCGLEKEEAAWKTAFEIINLIETVPLYKLAISKPHDDIYWQELAFQASIAAGQIAQKNQNAMEFSMKVGTIIGSYIDLLKEKCRKK